MAVVVVGVGVVVCCVFVVVWGGCVVVCCAFVVGWGGVVGCFVVAVVGCAVVVGCDVGVVEVWFVCFTDLSFDGLRTCSFVVCVFMSSCIVLYSMSVVLVSSSVRVWR